MLQHRADQVVTALLDLITWVHRVSPPSRLAPHEPTVLIATYPRLDCSRRRVSTTDLMLSSDINFDGSRLGTRQLAACLHGAGVRAALMLSSDINFGGFLIRGSRGERGGRADHPPIPW